MQVRFDQEVVRYGALIQNSNTPQGSSGGSLIQPGLIRHRLGAVGIQLQGRPGRLYGPGAILYSHLTTQPVSPYTSANPAYTQSVRPEPRRRATDGRTKHLTPQESLTLAPCHFRCQLSTIISTRHNPAPQKSNPRTGRPRQPTPCPNKSQIVPTSKKSNPVIPSNPRKIQNPEEQLKSWDQPASPAWPTASAL